MRSGSLPGRIFCIVKQFELLHSQEFAREGGHAAFLSSAHPLPADNAIERLARRSSLTVHQKRDSHSAVPFFCTVRQFKTPAIFQEFAREGGHEERSFRCRPVYASLSSKGASQILTRFFPACSPCKGPASTAPFAAFTHKIGIQPQIAPVRRFEPLLGDAR